MEDLIYNYARFKQEKAKFEALKDIDPKDYLLHRLRDLQEDLVERIEELKIEVSSVRRILDWEKELIQAVNLD